MKVLIVLIILTGLGLVGSAFFGVYTAPGLEGIPTVESIGVERRKTQTDIAQEKFKGTKNAGANRKVVVPVNANGAANRRRNQINRQQNAVEGR